ncbi:ketoacyl-ACP synthase III [Paenibacillus polymyxa]|uniref:ketoacyl-ACP synthase III n=1 Tax=Paenibacillus polymyxa TaxID=1406 RepID=UPI0004DA7F93|nr:ketoacyl-ACP synthase III [Paenibacillus polymyxa]KEO78317.1 3-oxoacyl-ACP synthase [Paenibacillus polymyxa]MCH6187095.1 ketoacyl-ACP synthase III [Paenibacillus polymyxa]MDY8093049.1 ketoacyl-ACP synthase III [Paenibacillus polymyxa]WRL58885.1 ketoacyl-ACP synthase III [Paenibacillus polymyxa]
MSHIKIKALGVYHPSHSLDNEYYVRHFDERGKDIRRFMEHMGRRQRYIIDDPNENGLTMGIAAAQKALEQAGMTGRDVDMIVFSTQVPESLFPMNALFVHHAIGARHDVAVMDSNANCAGMTVAVDQASRSMLSNPDVRTALIIGSDYNSLISGPEDEITYANYGDAACAAILERTEEDTGFIDSMYFTDPVNIDKILYPAQGLAATLQRNAPGKYIQWLPFDANMALPPTFDLLERILKKNGLSPQDVRAYCLSQFSLANVLKIQDHLELEDAQMIYVGDRYGYTGTSSPFIALYEGIESGRIRRGDYVLFWTIGAGYQLVAVLFKY